MEEIIDSLVEAIMQDIMQRHIRKLQDLFNAVPDKFKFTFLAAMRVTLDALLPTLNDHDRELYNAIVEGSQTVVIPVKKPKEANGDG